MIGLPKSIFSEFSEFQVKSSKGEVDFTQFFISWSLRVLWRYEDHILCLNIWPEVKLHKYVSVFTSYLLQHICNKFGK